ncbi:hypothetical protein FACS1894103_6570 [Campylobacterota bacterium]|nr:hypothetical protein FACS1894103_6570 [Campylobacterota bacterium]
MAKIGDRLGFPIEAFIADPSVAARDAQAAHAFSPQEYINALFLAPTPIPPLLIEDVSVEFQMEVSDTQSAKKVSGSGNPKLFKTAVNDPSKISSSREHTRSTNQSAKYQVKTRVPQQQPKGLSRVMNTLNVRFDEAATNMPAAHNDEQAKPTKSS